MGFTGPFKSRRGTHYFWIIDKRSASTNSYEQILDELRNKYTSERSNQIQEQYFKKLITDQPEFTGETKDPATVSNFGTGLGGLVEPTNTAKNIASQTIGNYVSGRSYQGSDGVS